MYFLKNIVDFSKEHPYKMIINMIFMTLIPINEVLLPHLYGKLLESIQKKKKFMKEFLCLIFVLIVVQCGYSLGDWHDTFINPSFQSFVRQSMLNTILEKYDNKYQDIAAGDIITKFVKAPFIMIEWFKSIKDYLMPYILVIICASIYFCYYDVILGLSLIITMTMILLLLIISPFTCIKETSEQSRVFHQLHEEIDDILRNLIAVYASEQQKQELERIRVMDGEYKIAFSDTMKCCLKYKIIGIPLIITFFTIFVYRCNYLITNNKLKTSTFVSLFIIILYMMSSMMWMVDIIRNIIFDWGMIKETENMLEYVPLIPIVSNNTSKLIPSNGIGLYNVNFSYDDSIEPVLKNISLYFAPGEKVVLTGNIGCGKSTILKLFMRFYIPQSGDLFINGKWYSEMETNQIRHKIGYIPQTPILFNRSIYDNIKYGNNTITNMYIDQTIEQLQIANEFSNLENGLETMIGKGGSKLSGGQKQLIWCLRVLLQDDIDVILMDEFTSAMDAKTKDLIIKILDILLNDKIIIMVTHDPYLIKFATRNVAI